MAPHAGIYLSHFKFPQHSVDAHRPERLADLEQTEQSRHRFYILMHNDIALLIN